MCSCATELRRPDVSRRSALSVAPVCSVSSRFQPRFQARVTDMHLSEKSNDEIKKLLADHGIKHGPVVDSTRKQYEKKLEKAMETSSLKSSSDRTFYREEEEEVTYITYRNPVRDEGVEIQKRRGVINEDEDEDKESVQATGSTIQFSSRTVNHSAVHSRMQSKGPAKSVWKVIRLLLLLAVLAAVFYYAYCRLWS